MIAYGNKGKVSTKRLLELISKHRKDKGYMVNIWKLILFLYTNNKKFDIEIKNTTYNSIKNTKFLRINITKYV